MPMTITLRISVYLGLILGGYKMKNILYGSTARRRVFEVDAVTFDGTNDYMRRGGELTGAADGKVGLLSFWYKSNRDGTTDQDFIFNITGYFYCRKLAGDNKIWVIGTSAPGPQVLNINSTAVLIASGWTHFMASWNLAATTTHLYINGVDAKTQTTATDTDIDYVRAGPNWSIGDNLAGTNLIQGDVAELIFALEYLDLSVAANRAKLYSGKPVDPGDDGSLVTGTAPIIYQSVRTGDAATVFATNKGSGGNFAITGALAIAATSPSD